LPLFVRLIRAEMTAVLNQEYIKFAWAKGLAPGRIWWLHAFKNTLLPLITVGGMQIGGLVAYAILTETIFQWPGMGALFLQSVNRADGPVVTAYLLVVGVIFVITSTLVDLLYGLVDPRIRLSGTAP
jgi:peptide/nickel transport system permease protein